MNWLLFFTGLAIGIIAFNKNIPAPPPENEWGHDELNDMARTAIKLGYMALVAWLVPIIGLPISVAGLILSIRSTSSQYTGVTRATTHCTIGLILTAMHGCGVMMGQMAGI